MSLNTKLMLPGTKLEIEIIRGYKHMGTGNMLLEVIQNIDGLSYEPVVWIYMNTRGLSHSMVLQRKDVESVDKNIIEFTNGTLTIFETTAMCEFKGDTPLNKMYMSSTEYPDTLSVLKPILLK